MEQLIVEAGWKAYDNASNGNKTRGGVKKASQMYASRHSSHLDPN